MNIAEMAQQVTAFTGDGRRSMVAIVGAPGSGKSTVADELVEALGDRAVLLPMDAFHLSNAVLEARGARDRKGAIDTFDADGFVATLRRVRADDTTVMAPRFHRDIEESIAAEIEITPEHRIVVAEGLYLLADTAPWHEVRELVDRAWYLDVDDAVRHEWLIARHIRFGRTPEDARAWALGTDETNARLVAATAHRADEIIKVG